MLLSAASGAARRQREFPTHPPGIRRGQKLQADGRRMLTASAFAVTVRRRARARVARPSGLRAYALTRPPAMLSRAPLAQPLEGALQVVRLRADARVG